MQSLLAKTTTCLKKNGPVRASRRYLDNRTDQLGCARAFALDLPGGSGLIESGLRHVHPARFKQATATSAQPASNKPAPRGLKPTLTPSASSAPSAPISAGMPVGPATDFTAHYPPEWADVAWALLEPRDHVHYPDDFANHAGDGLFITVRSLAGIFFGFCRSRGGGAGGRDRWTREDRFGGRDH